MLVKADLVHPGSRRLGTSLGLPLGPSCHSRHPNLALPHRASISGQADQSHALWVFGSAWGEHTTLNIFQPSAWLKRLKSFCFTKFHMFRISAALTFSSQLVQWSDIRLLHARRGRGRRFAWFHSIPFDPGDMSCVSFVSRPISGWYRCEARMLLKRKRKEAAKSAASLSWTAWPGRPGPKRNTKHIDVKPGSWGFLFWQQVV